MQCSGLGDQGSEEVLTYATVELEMCAYVEVVVCVSVCVHVCVHVCVCICVCVHVCVTV